MDAGEAGKHWISGVWWRRRYFIQDGMIRPIAGSKLEPYDPWEHYRHDGHPLPGQSPHLALAELDLDSEPAIEAFVSEWGLLGIFHEQLIETQYHPDKSQRLGVIESGWEDVCPLGFDPVDRVLARLRNHSGIETGTVRSYYGGYTVGLDLSDEALATSFPMAHSVLLWDHLAEPLEQFRQWAGDFQEWTRGATAKYAPGDYEGEVVANSLRHELNAALWRVHPILLPDNKRGWQFRSLWGALCMMLSEDVAGGRLRRCANPRCGRPFNPRRSDQEYCSRTCLNRVKDPISRERRKDGSK